MLTLNTPAHCNDRPLNGSSMVMLNDSPRVDETFGAIVSRPDEATSTRRDHPHARTSVHSTNTAAKTTPTAMMLVVGLLKNSFIVWTNDLRVVFFVGPMPGVEVASLCSRAVRNFASHWQHLPLFCAFSFNVRQKHHIDISRVSQLRLLRVVWFPFLEIVAIASRNNKML